MTIAPVAAVAEQSAARLASDGRLGDRAPDSLERVRGERDVAARLRAAIRHQKAATIGSQTCSSPICTAAS